MKIKCEICNESCDGKIIIKDINIKRELKVCGNCLNDFGNQDYDKLNEKLDKIE